MRRIVDILIGIFWLALSSCAIAENNVAPVSFFQEIFSRYDLISVVYVKSAEAVSPLPAEENKPANACFFNYDVQVINSLKGLQEQSMLTVSSDIGLTVGEYYLVGLNSNSAGRAKEKQYFLNQAVNEICDNRIGAYFMAYSDVNIVEEIWDGKNNVTVVRFSDSSVEGVEFREMIVKKHDSLEDQYIGPYIKFSDVEGYLRKFGR